METQDNSWLRRYRAGDVGAIGEMVEHYRRPLFGYILRMTESQDDAEDIFQEVWIRALRHVDQYKEKRLLSWLFRIAHNLIIDRARKKKPDISLNASFDDQTSLEERVPGPLPSPADQAGDKDTGQRITIAVNQLPLEQRSVFLMRMHGNLSFKEIARLQGISVNTALGRMHYAIEKLRKRLADEYADYARD